MAMTEGCLRAEVLLRATQDKSRLRVGLGLSSEGVDEFVEAHASWTMDDVVRVAEALGMEITYRVDYVDLDDL